MVNYNRKYTREELIDYLKKLSNELGRSPTSTEMDKTKGYPNSSTYSVEFMSWNNALEEAGLELHRKDKFKDSELLYYLQKLALKLGKVPSQREMMRVKGYPSVSAYRLHFKSWRNALEKAGFKNNDNKQLNKHFL